MTSLDPKFAAGVVDGVQALISEVVRLEAVGRELEAKLAYTEAARQDACAQVSIRSQEFLDSQSQNQELREALKAWLSWIHPDTMEVGHSAWPVVNQTCVALSSSPDKEPSNG